MSLLAKLRSFDGKHTAVLEQLSDTLPRNIDSVAQLLMIAEHDDTKMQVAATWLLKQWHEEGVPEIAIAVADLIQIAKDATYWEVRLHLLQLLASIHIPASSMPTLRKLLPGLMADENKFVRAWAISVFAAMGDQNDSLRKKVGSVLVDAENDEAASVRARVRQLRKKYRWARTDQDDRTKH